MIRRNSIKIIIIAVLLAFAVAALFFWNNRKTGARSEGLSHFSVKTFETETGWAYRIYQDTTPVIEQLSIPGLPGKSGFKTRELAFKTATLVKQKLDNGIFPPSITPEELDSLGVK